MQVTNAQSVRQRLKKRRIAWMRISRVILLGLSVPIAAYSTNGTNARAQPSALKPFAGEWRGTGTMVLENDKKERIRCRMMVKLGSGGIDAVYTVKCASTGRDVIVKSDLKVHGQEIYGSWHSKSGGERGTLKGRAAADTLRLTLNGATVDAQLVAIASQSRQSFVITGKMGSIRKIAVKLKRRK